MVRQQRNIELMRAIGCKLRQIRKQCGLSQEKVLFRTGIYLNRIENGRSNISVSTLITLCTAYGITLHDFFKSLNYGATDTQ